MGSPSKVVHLHNHSEFSFLDGIPDPVKMVAASVADGQPAVSITDHGTTAGAWRFAKAAHAAGIKPIIGMEGYLAIGSRHEQNVRVVAQDASDLDADDGGKEKRYEHLTMLAATKTGWNNLVRISNEANRTGYWYKPRFDWELLDTHRGGLIYGTGCLGGPVAAAILRGDLPAAKAAIARLVDIAGRDHVFVEVMNHGLPEEAIVLPVLTQLAREFALPVVATNDAHYLCDTDADAHAAWLRIGSKGKFKFHGTGYHLRTAAEMHAVFDSLPGCENTVANTLAIAQMVEDDVLPEAKMRLPRFPIPEGFTDAAAYLHHKVREGAIRRYGTQWPAALAPRLRFEMDTVVGAGVDDYMLIVEELVSWARSAGILPGPGRGSGAGSAIAYCLGITNVEPLVNGLLFERFLNPERVGLPDFDIDFEAAHKDRVTAHLAALYGADKVAKLATYGVTRSRAAVKSAARDLRLPPSLGDRLSKLIPMAAGGKPMEFAAMDDAGQAAAGFHNLVASDPNAARVVALARTIENVVSTPGIHACGVIVSNESFDDLGIPVRVDRKGSGALVVEWDGRDAGDSNDGGVGLLKLDRLGLRNLDIVSRCIRGIEAATGEVIDTDSLDPDEDSDRARAAWAMLSSGRTAGVFQIESPGMTKLCEGMSPHGLNDLSALVALYRPGPMGAGMHDRYVSRKRGLENVSYGYLTRVPDEVAVIESVLGQTYGVLAYQEQLMQLSNVVAGFGPAQSNKLLKAFSKKRKEVMDALEGPFVAGGRSATFPDGTPKVPFQESTLQELWRTFKASSEYLFNRSHSAAYGLISYWTAYLKANWTDIYCAALLACTENAERRRAILAALREEGIDVLAPDVNVGDARSSSVDGKVRIGLGEVKDVGSNAVAIISEREANGPYTSLADLVRRSGANSRVIEALIDAGACDQFGPRRGLATIARIVKLADDVPVPDMEWGTLERAARERERLGVNVSGHPVAALRAEIAAWRDPRGGAVPMPVHRITPEHSDKTVCVIGVIGSWTETAYSGGRRANFVVEGSRGEIPGVMWNREVAALHATGDTPRMGDLVAVVGQATVRSFEVRVDGRAADEVDEDDETAVMETVTRVEMRASRIVPVPVGDDGHVLLADVIPLRRGVVVAAPDIPYVVLPPALPDERPDAVVLEMPVREPAVQGETVEVMVNMDDADLDMFLKTDPHWLAWMPCFTSNATQTAFTRWLCAAGGGPSAPFTARDGTQVVFVQGETTDLDLLRESSQKGRPFVAVGA